MKVSQLIQELQNRNPDEEVIVTIKGCVDCTSGNFSDFRIRGVFQKVIEVIKPLSIIHEWQGAEIITRRIEPEKKLFNMTLIEVNNESIDEENR